MAEERKPDAPKPEGEAPAAGGAAALPSGPGTPTPSSGKPSEHQAGVAAAVPTAAEPKVAAAPATERPAAPAGTPGKVEGAATKPAAPKPPPKPAAEGHGAEGQKAAPMAGLPEPPPPESVTIPPFVARALAVLGSKIEKVAYWVGEWSLRISPDDLIEGAIFLRDDPETAFDFCSDVTAVDFPTRARRFDVVYELYSTRRRHRVRLKLSASETDPVPSVSRVWPAANWLEREVYDMFGVNFTGHPDRRRILMPEDWQGFPERKDYPLEGPGELLMENPLDWLRLRQARDEQTAE